MSVDSSRAGRSQIIRIILGFVVLFGFLARAATYKSPLLDHHAWRQADTASIARNFYRERFNILYPQVDQRGGQQAGYVETGLELFAFLVALVAKGVGFHHEIGRLLSAGLFICSDLMVWTFVSRRYGARCGFIATFLYAFGFPLLLLIERSFMNESLLICLSIACLLQTQRYLAHRRARDFVTVVVMSAVIGAVKLPYLIIWAPIVGLFVEAYGPRVVRWELGVMMAVDLLAAFAWYRHAHLLAVATGLSFDMTDKLFDRALVTSPTFVWVMSTRLFKDVLGPVGVAGALAGLWFGCRERRWCELFGVAGFVLYLVLVARGNYAHDYYQLAVIPVASSLVAFGLWRLAHVGGGGPGRRRGILVAALAIAVASTFIRSVSAHSWYDYPASQVELCRAVNELSRPDERVVLLGTTDPKLLFCMDRKGWVLPSLDDDLAVRDAWQHGATLTFIPKPLTNQKAERFVRASGVVVLSTLDVDVVRLPAARISDNDVQGR
jgi:hypothetical protein